MEWYYILIIILLAVILGLVIYYSVTINNVRTYAEKRARELMDERTETLLRLSAIPFVWLIRIELLRENLNAINDYFYQYVREPGIFRISLVDTDGRVLVSSDKKWEDQPFSRFSDEDLSRESYTLLNKENDEKTIIIPVTGLNNKLGTVVIQYRDMD